MFLFHATDALNKFRVPLPITEDAHQMLTINGSEGLVDSLNAMRGTIKSCLLTYSNRLSESGWGMAAFALIRIAVFAQSLANFHQQVTTTPSYTDGFHANELAYVVIGTLHMAGLTIYTNRVVLPSIDKYTEPLRGEQRILFENLRRLFVMELDSTQVQTQEWLENNVSPASLAI